MSTKKYLDNNGLLYVWGKIKTYVTNQLAPYAKTADLPDEYTLPTASSTTLGGIKIGSGLNISNGTVSVSAGGVADSVAWTGVQGTPTTLAGYGITDAKIASGVITLGENTITPLTSHQSLAAYAKTADLPTKTSDLTNNSGFITSSAIPTNVSDFTNDAGYLTSHQPLTNYYTKTEVDNKVSSVFKYKGSKTAVSSLPTAGNTTGDVWSVGDQEYVWNGTEWEEFGVVVDLSGYVEDADLSSITNAEIDNLMS